MTDAAPTTMSIGGHLVELRDRLLRFVLVVVVLAIILVAMGFKVVEQGYEYTVERFGRHRVDVRRYGERLSVAPERIGAEPLV